MDDARKLISIVVPAFNEQENVRVLYNSVTAVMKVIEDKYDHEIVFTDNCSEDRTFEVLEEIAAADNRVRVIRFSKNFGFQRSIFTGYLNARGAAAIQLDCDLQDPPELILDFIRKWEEGYRIVYGVRRSRKEAWWITRLRSSFYYLIDLLSEDRLPLNAGDFRLIDRVILDELKKVDDQTPYLRGTIAAMGFKQTGIEYDRAERLRGESKFPLRRMIGFAVDGILNHSVIPLRVATFIGLATSLITLLSIPVYLIGRLILAKDWPAGFATTTILMLLSISLNALFLGIIGEYLGRIYKQVKRRPITIVEKSLNQP